MFDQILLAIDGSEPSMHAAKVAGDLVRAVHAKELRIVIAYEPVPAYLGEPDLSRTINDRMSETKSILEEAEEAVGEIPARLENELLQGHMAESIIDVATTQHSDLIVMGTRALGRLAGAFLGSNSQKVIHEAPCPVLLVK